nr:uncharacterized protein LOC103229108 [Chlorocebus sabaeus]
MCDYSVPSRWTAPPCLALGQVGTWKLPLRRPHPEPWLFYRPADTNPTPCEDGVHAAAITDPELSTPLGRRRGLAAALRTHGGSQAAAGPPYPRVPRLQSLPLPVTAGSPSRCHGHTPRVPKGRDTHTTTAYPRASAADSRTGHMLFLAGFPSVAQGIPHCIYLHMLDNHVILSQGTSNDLQ